MVAGSGGNWVSDKELVDSVLRDLEEAAERWEAVVVEAATVTYSVDLGDIQAVANSDGKLVALTMHPEVVSRYNHIEIADRLNLAFTALREEAELDYRARYGGNLQ